MTSLLLIKWSGEILSYLLSVLPLRRVPRPVHWAVGLPSTCPQLLPPERRAERSFSLLFSPPPPIALAISYGSQPRGPALRGQGGLSGQVSPHSNYVRGSFALPDLERYYESSVPDSIAAAIWFTGTTKKSHAYVTVIDGFIILDHEDPGRASGFHSHHHIDDKSPRALPLRTWSPYHGEGKVTL